MNLYEHTIIARQDTSPAQLKQLQEKTVSCKDVTFKIFGFSLTTLNIIVSLFITIILTKIYLRYEKNR